MKRSWLLPGVATALFSIALNLVMDRPGLVGLLLALYICGVAYFFVDLFCHERKPFWVAAVVAVFTFLMLSSPLLNLLLYPFRTPWSFDVDTASQLAPLPRLGAFFVSAGLAEEFIKAIPVGLAVLIGRRFRGRLARALRVATPVDGILVGAASGIGFAFTETVFQYVPMSEHSVDVASSDIGLGYYVGVITLILRLVGVVFGHLAWAGYFGYFIGLAASRLASVWKALLVGWLSAAALHGLWDAFDTSTIASIIIASLSYCCLAAAILEARRLHCIDPLPPRALQPSPQASYGSGSPPSGLVEGQATLRVAGDPPAG